MFFRVFCTGRRVSSGAGLRQRKQSSYVRQWNAGGLLQAFHEDELAPTPFVTRHAPPFAGGRCRRPAVAPGTTPGMSYPVSARPRIRHVCSHFYT
jgi:hypothetical protein